MKKTFVFVLPLLILSALAVSIALTADVKPVEVERIKKSNILPFFFLGNR